jgi:hypothetical protein
VIFKVMRQSVQLAQSFPTLEFGGDFLSLGKVVFYLAPTECNITLSEYHEFDRLTLEFLFAARAA